MNVFVEEYAQVASTEPIAEIVRLLSVDSGMTTARPSYVLRKLYLPQWFSILVSKWKADTQLSSSTTEICTHPVYQGIIGMGPAVLPLIFKELEREPDHWFWALKAITGADPVATEHVGRLDDMARDWLRWARIQGYR